MFQLLEQQGVPTHFVEQLSERETVVKKVSIVPLEVIIRNISAGSFAKRYGVEEGIVFDEPTVEFSYKNDDLGDPLMNAYHAIALKLATREEIEHDQGHGVQGQRGHEGSTSMTLNVLAGRFQAGVRQDCGR